MPRRVVPSRPSVTTASSISKRRSIKATIGTGARSAPTRRRRSRATSIIGARGAYAARAGRPGQQRHRLHPRFRRRDRQVALDVPHRAAAPASPATKPGSTTPRGRAAATPASGPRSRPTSSSGSRICPSNRRTATCTAAFGPARISTARASSRSICAPASGAGTSRRRITRSGTTTFRPRRSSSTPSRTARPIKALAQATKQGLLFVLNRETGEPIWPIPEVAVPQGNVPGEWYSPTQPIPPLRYGHQGVAIDDLIDFTPAAAGRGRARSSRSTGSDRSTRRPCRSTRTGRSAR